MDKILTKIQLEYEAKLDSYIKKEFSSLDIPQVWSTDEELDSEDSTTILSVSSTLNRQPSTSNTQSKSSKSSMIPLFQPVSKVSFSSGFADQQEVFLSADDFPKISFNLPLLQQKNKPAPDLLTGDFENRNSNSETKTMFVTNMMSGVNDEDHFVEDLIYL